MRTHFYIKLLNQTDPKKLNKILQTRLSLAFFPTHSLIQIPHLFKNFGKEVRLPEILGMDMAGCCLLALICTSQPRLLRVLPLEAALRTKNGLGTIPAYFDPRCFEFCGRFGLFGGDYFRICGRLGIHTIRTSMKKQQGSPRIFFSHLSRRAAYEPSSHIMSSKVTA